MRRKVFIASKSVKIAVAIFAGAVILAGMLGAFYSNNKTLEYAGQAKENQALVTRVGAFADGNAYRAEISKKTFDLKRAQVYRVHTIAQDLDLLGSGEITSQKVEDFLGSTSANKASIPSPTDAVYGEYIDDLKLMIDRMLYFSESLSSENTAEFDLKLRLFGALCDVSDSLDCQATFAGNNARAGAARNILEQVHVLRESSASEEHKEKLISVCVPKLSKPYNLPLMLKTEHLRILEGIDIVEGIGPGLSNAFGKPPKNPMSLAMKLESKLPGVLQAWKSRVNFEFWQAIADYDSSKDRGFRDGHVLKMAEKRLTNNPASKEYLDLFIVNFGGITLNFSRKEQLIYRLSLPRVPKNEIPVTERKAN